MFAKGFTNHEQTDPSGLIYMQARFYLPWYGRFASPDPARDQHFELTQSWNIYSYVRNNPTMCIDPTGMYEWGSSLGGDATDDQLRKSKQLDILDARKKFRSSLDSAQRAANVVGGERKEKVEAGITAYGKEGEKGVTIQLGGTDPGADAHTRMEEPGKQTVAFASADTITAENTAHEGTHVRDNMRIGWIMKSEIDLGSGEGNVSRSSPWNLTKLDRETRAYEVTAYVLMGLGKNNVGYSGLPLFDPKLKTINYENIRTHIEKKYTELEKRIFE